MADSNSGSGLDSRSTDCSSDAISSSSNASADAGASGPSRSKKRPRPSSAPSTSAGGGGGKWSKATTGHRKGARTVPMLDAKRMVRLVLEYDGTAFAGSQLQPAPQRTVQGEVEAALERCTGEEAPRLLLASRTDRGVHARGQVAAVRTACALEGGELRRTLNAYLPPDLVIREASTVHDRFDPREDARSKHYRYTCHVGPIRPVIGRQAMWYIPPPRVKPGKGGDEGTELAANGATADGTAASMIAPRIDVEAMNEAAKSLQGGPKDFTSLSNKTKEGAKDPHCHLNKVTVTHAADADILEFDFFGDRFLYNMVRIIVGTLVEVGTGRRTVEDFRATMDARDRTRGGPAAPAQGLTLMEIYYPEEVECPEDVR